VHPHGSFPKESISPEIIERMWAYSFSEKNPKFRKIALNALVRLLPDPEISNLILKEETTVKPSKQPLKKSPLKREEPLPPGFFNF
jgi:hypothetical protein